mmetsp:Transcript_38413/g.58490  ORF Transcript_38413/g.58490 Transcript_38413/m.58490 type:complete len:107 (+) Transcript_38413:3431-3751(+)
MGQKNVPISYPSFGRKVNFVQFMQPMQVPRASYACWRDEAEIAREERMSPESVVEQPVEEEDPDFKTTPTPVERRMPEISLQRPSEVYNTSVRPEENDWLPPVTTE